MSLLSFRHSLRFLCDFIIQLTGLWDEKPEVETVKQRAAAAVDVALVMQRMGHFLLGVKALFDSRAAGGEIVSRADSIGEEILSGENS